MLISRKARAPLHLLLVSLVLASAVTFALALSTNSATGDEPPTTPESPAPTAAQTKEALESGNAKPILDEPETDLQAAQTMPHRNLGRTEALQLAEAVFQPEIEGAGGIYGELEPEKFLSDNAAIVPASSLPDRSEQAGGSLPSEHPNTPVLIESMLPLRVENGSGVEEAVDLQLEHSEGELQSQNPLAEVGIPAQLGEGISMPGSEVEITVSGAAEDRTATNAAGEFAFYPEVSTDSDLIVTPTPQGVETMTDLRSPEAATETTYELTLPSAAELRASPQGGAEVVEGPHATLLVLPPSATDAAGNPVPTELTVSGDSLTVVAKPTPSSAFPVLVDPVFIEEGWRWTSNHDSLGAWSPTTTNVGAMRAVPWAAWGAENQWPGLDVTSGYGAISHWGTHADWEYWVPRYHNDVTYVHEAPSTWVYQMYVEGPQFYEYGNTENYPAMVVGLIDPSVGWQGTPGVHYGGQGDLTDWTHPYWYTNPTEQHGTKGADMNLVTYAEEVPAKRRDTFLADAYVAVVDEDAPFVTELNPSSRWVKGYVWSFPYRAEDRGLGVKSLEVSYEGHSLKESSYPCSGEVKSPCPRTLTSASQSLEFNTASPGAELPTGPDFVTVTAKDPMWSRGIAGHTGSGKLLVKVDHTGPEVSLSGSLAEQGGLGTHRSTYALRVAAKDGVEGAPQSGVRKVEVKVDGKPVAMPEASEWEPNCQTQNCPVDGEWTMSASEYGPGFHEVQVIATDAVGNATTRTLQVEFSPTAPTLSLSGSLTEQATRGTERPSYTLEWNASSSVESPTPAAPPTYSSLFGSAGTGNGQFAHPGDVAIGDEGNLFVVDTNNNRIEKFSESGTYVSQFGTKGSGNGQLNRPTAIAVAANGNLWVTDSFNRRVEEFTPAGAYVAQFGSAGTGAGQFAGAGPEGVAVDYHGNIWVSDTYGGRLEKFSENGVFIRSVGVKGKSYEQLGQPTALDVAPGGHVYVTDWEDDKVAEYGEEGAFIRQFGSQGTEPGQLEQPTGIAIDSKGDVWVGDQENERVEEYNLAGEYLGRFGGGPSPNPGLLNLRYPIGIASDEKGDIWVTDPENNRVEKFVSANYLTPSAPSYLRAFSEGHLSFPRGVAVDPTGHLWVADGSKDVIEKFASNGRYITSYGSLGSGNGQLNEPAPIAMQEGHVWVAEEGNERVQELSESGGFLAKLGFAGTSGGPLKWPWGLAIDPNHHVWVSEFMNSRVKEFSESGSLIRTVGTAGTGNGQFGNPAGVAVGPGNTIWVADNSYDRVEEFNETGEFLRQFGPAANEVGRLQEPIGIYVDASEHVWVVDRPRDRVVEFNGHGEYLRQFGAAGEPPGAPGTFLYPQYITGDAYGHLFVSNPGDARVDEWTVPPTHSGLSREILVDGKRVKPGVIEKSCATESCQSSGEWTFNASSYGPGPHEVTMRVTDGLGDTTSRTLHIQSGDTTKPALAVGGELAAAPEGWIEQAEGNYGLNASATDTGFGVTSLTFSLDGKTVASKTQSCGGGACPASISTTVNAHELSAGAHPAEVVAKDGAGNVATKKWTVNVDPEGSISTEELAATAEAAEETNGSPILTAADEIPGVEGSTAGVGLAKGEEPGAFVATGTDVPMLVGAEPEEGFRLHIAGLQTLAIACDEVEGPENECVPRATLEAAQAAQEQQVAEGRKYPGMTAITVKPVVTGPAATEQELIGEQTAASANAGGQELDTFTRPLSDGGLSFADIRGPASPEHYAYEMTLDPELQLRQPDPQHIEVVYWRYGVTAFVITAEAAHDVIGSTVPTHLSISGPEKLTLTVEHRAPSPAGGTFVYPVMGGTGWQGGYYVKGYEMNEPPPPAAEESEEGEGSVTSEGDFLRLRMSASGPPVPNTNESPGGQLGPAGPAHWFVFSECIVTDAKEVLEEAVGKQNYAAIAGNCSAYSVFHKPWRGTAVRGWAHVNSAGWVWINPNVPKQLECPHWGKMNLALVHCYANPQKANPAITVGGDWRSPVGEWLPRFSSCLTVYGHLQTDKRPHAQAEESIERFALPGEACNWPAE